MKYQTSKGTNDRLPEDSRQWRFILEIARRVLENAGAEEIHTPIFEYSGVFTKAVGESSDIVRKEMFSFKDKGDRDLTLRPEATAAIVRAFLQHGMSSKPMPVRLWTFEPMFRGEQPQRGRERQFHQIGLETIGQAEAVVDAEAIQIGHAMLRAIGLKDFVVHLGSVGDPYDRAQYNQYLKEQLSPHHVGLSEDSQERLRLNPMRILDSKNTIDQTLLQTLNIQPMLNFLGQEAKEHFENTQQFLRDWKVPFVVDPSIVRGLDYYRRTAFEFIHQSKDMAACATILAGGRYDGLAEILGGPATPGVGWGCGIERVVLAMQAENVLFPKLENAVACFIPLDNESVSYAFLLANDLRTEIKSICLSKVKKLGKALEDAEKRGAEFAIVVGESERKSDTLMVRKIQTREQFEVEKNNLLVWLKENRST